MKRIEQAAGEPAIPADAMLDVEDSRPARAPVALDVLIDWSQRLRERTLEIRAVCMEARAHARDLRLRNSHLPHRQRLVAGPSHPR